jgi:hypothetical protein
MADPVQGERLTNFSLSGLRRYFQGSSSVIAQMDDAMNTGGCYSLLIGIGTRTFPYTKAFFILLRDYVIKNGFGSEAFLGNWQA